MNTTDKPTPTDDELKALFEEKQNKLSERQHTAVSQDGRDAFAFVLDHLKPWLRDTAQPAALPWVSLKERQPTEADADHTKRVLFYSSTSCLWGTERYDKSPTEFTHFLPFSPPPGPSQDELDREAFEKLGEEYQWNLSRTGDLYINEAIHERWVGFRAALELGRKQS